MHKIWVWLINASACRPTGLYRPGTTRQLITGGAVAQPCVNSHWEALEPVIFWPPTESTYFNRLLKNLSHVHDFYSCAKFGGNPSMGGFGANTWNINYISFFIYALLFKQLTYKSDRSPHFTLNGSNDADTCKGVSFLALVDIAAHLGDQIAQKPQYSGCEWAFSSQTCQILKCYENYCIDHNQILHNGNGTTDFDKIWRADESRPSLQ